MNDFFFARLQMAMPLAFHIVFAALNVGMPILITMAEGMHFRIGEIKSSFLFSTGTATWPPRGGRAN